jgi:hypothetical protein
LSIDLSDFTDSLQREVQPPGTVLFAGVSDDTWVGYLADAFWEAKLDGFMGGYECDPDGIITPDGSGPDLTRDQVALVLIYAGIKIIRNRLIGVNSKFHAKAGPVEIEQDYSATLMTEMLKSLNAVKDRLLALKTFTSDITLIDGFSARSISGSSYSGYLYDWYLGAFGANWADIQGQFQSFGTL